MNFFFTYMKMSKDSSTSYYQNNKEKLQKRSREKYRSLHEEEKEKNATI